MEHRSYDELSRLWQATTAPLRLGVVYRAAVVFITPDEPAAAREQVTTVTPIVNGTDTVTVVADAVSEVAVPVTPSRAG